MSHYFTTDSRFSENRKKISFRFLGVLETNEFFNDIATDTSFSEYKSQQQINSLKFRVHKYFEISDYYNFMFFKIPEISGSTLYRIDNIENTY